MASQGAGRHWSGLGWSAEIVKSEDGPGWALAMTRDGHDEPLMTVPWIMGRNKVDPKPMNVSDYATQVKAAQDFLDRREQQIRLAHRRSYDVDAADGQRIRVVFDVIPDDVEPEGQLVALDPLGEEQARDSAPASFRLTRASAKAWVDGGYGQVWGE
jgi:hypothetical protein